MLDDILPLNRDGFIATSRERVSTPLSSELPVEPESGEDLTLLKRVASGERCAVGELYDVHGGLLFGLLVRILGRRDEAEEVLQEVFVQAWTQAHTYNPSRGTAAGWLCGIARSRAIDRLRDRTPGVRTREGSTAPLPPESPEAIVSTSERNPDVHVALQCLPSDQRELIERAYFTGATQSEMATDLGLPLATVMTRVRAGLQTLGRAPQAPSPNAPPH